MGWCVVGNSQYNRSVAWYIQETWAPEGLGFLLLASLEGVLVVLDPGFSGCGTTPKLTKEGLLCRAKSILRGFIVPGRKTQMYLDNEKREIE